VLHLLLAASLLNAPAPAEETPAPPKGPQPRVCLASADADGNVRLHVFVAEVVPVKETQTVDENGRLVQREVTVYRTTSRELEQKYPARDVQAFDPRGKPLDARAVAEALKKEAVVLVSADGNPVDPFYLKIVKESTLVLVLPGSKDKAPVPVPPPPPREK